MILTNTPFVIRSCHIIPSTQSILLSNEANQLLTFKRGEKKLQIPEEIEMEEEEVKEDDRLKKERQERRKQVFNKRFM